MQLLIYMDSRPIINNNFEKLGVFLDSHCFDYLLSNSEKDAETILNYRFSEPFEFIRSPLATDKEKLKEVVQYNKIIENDNMMTIEVIRGDTHSTMYSGCRVESIIEITKAIFNKENPDDEEVSTVTLIFVQATLKKRNVQSIFVTDNNILLKNRLWFESHFPGCSLNIVTLKEAIEIMGLFSRYRGKFHILGNYYCKNKGDWYCLLFSTKVPYFHVDEYLFSWDEVPRNDSVRLIEYLKQEFDISWVETAKIEKIDNVGIIRVTTEKNYLSLGLNNEKTMVNLKIDDGRSAEFMAKSENGRLNIYVVDKILDAFSSRFVFLLMALDEMGFQYYQGVDNDTMDNTLYHFNYFISLITGIFDSLAIRTKNQYNLKSKYLFSWEEIPGNDSRKLTDFLKSNHDVDWVKTDGIAKTDNGKTIMITAGENFLSLNLNNEKTELNLIIDNVKIDEFLVKTENGKLNIYVEENEPSRTSLSRKAGKDFLNAVKEVNLELRKHITNCAPFINLIYQLRELILHREGLTKSGFKYEDKDKKWEANFINITKLEPLYINDLKDVDEKYQNTTSWGVYKLQDNIFLDPYIFSKKATSTLIDFSNKYLQLLNFNNFIQDLISKNLYNSFCKNCEIFNKGYLGTLPHQTLFTPPPPPSVLLPPHPTTSSHKA